MNQLIPNLEPTALVNGDPSSVSVRLILTSHSIDNVFDYCARKFEFLNLYDKRPARESGFAAQVGTALHEAIQACLIARAEGKSEDEARGLAFKALFLFYPHELSEQQAQQTRDIHRTIALLFQIMDLKEWDDWELMRVDNGQWAVEVPFLIRHTSIGEFTVKSTGERCLLCTQGKIDFVLRHRYTGKIRGWDLKTTVNSLDLARSEYTYSGQQIGYGNVIHTMVGTAPEDFSVWYLIARFSASEPGEVVTLEMPKAQDILDDYWLAKLDRLQRMRSYAENGWFPRRNGGCNSWGNECQCFDICRSRDDDLVRRWFSEIQDAQPQQGYDWWVTMEI